MWSGPRERRGGHQGNGNFLKANLGKAEVKKAWAAECFRQPAPAARGGRPSGSLPVGMEYVGGGRAPEEGICSLGASGL